MSKLRRLVSSLLALSLLCPVVSVRASAYNDTGGHWAADAIERWTGRGVVQGDGTSFRPDAPITGGEIASVIAKTLNFNVFSTDSDDFWYSPYLRKCASERISVNTDKTYISRQDAMVALSQALSVTDGDRSALSSYLDADLVADTAVPHVSGMVSAGIVNGVSANRIAPEKSVTRAELITMLDRAIVQVISTPGEYELADAPGIILITCADVTLTGSTSTDIIVTNGADGGIVTFQDAIVTGRFTVRANNALIVNDNSELPMIGFFGWGSELAVLPVELPPVIQPVIKGSSKSEPVYKGLNITDASASQIIEGGVYSYVTIEKSLGNGEITLKNVTINDNLLIQGGGSNSIHLENCKINGEVRMEKSDGKPPRLHLQGTPVRKIVVSNPAIIEAEDQASVISSIQARSNLSVRGENTSIDSIEVKAVAQEQKPVALSLENGHIQKLRTFSPAALSRQSADIDTLLAGSQLTLREGTFPLVQVPADASASIYIDGGQAERIEVDGKAELHGEFDDVSARGSVTLQEGRIHTLRTPSGAGNAVFVKAAEQTKIDRAEVNRLTAFDAQGSIELVDARSDVTLMNGRLPALELRSGASSEQLNLTIIDGAEIDKTLVYTPNKIIVRGEGNNQFFAPDSSITPRLEFSYVPAGLLPHIHVYRDYTEVAPVTCTEDGRWTAQCIGCDQYLERTIKARGHIWGKPVIEAATTEKEGCKLFTCEKCGETRSEIIPKLPKTEEEQSFSISGIRFINQEHSLALTWESTKPASSTDLIRYTAEIQKEDGTWETLQSSLLVNQCSVLRVLSENTRYTAARIKMYSGSELVATAEQALSLSIEIAYSDKATVSFKNTAETPRATVRNAEHGYIYWLDILPPSYLSEQHVFVPDADGNAYFDLKCTSAVLGRSDYRLVRFVPSVTESGATLTIERTGWLHCTDAFAENHSIGYRIGENRCILLETDVENIEDCILNLKGAVGTADRRIELKDGLSLTERFLADEELYYQSAYLSRTQDNEEVILAHSSESLNVKSSKDTVAIQNAVCSEDGKITISVDAIDENFCYFLLADGSYLPLQMQDGQLTCSVEDDFSGKTIDVIRTYALKVGNSFTLYISPRGTGFVLPKPEEKEEPGTQPEEPKPEEKGEAGNPPEESKPEEKGETGNPPEESKPEEKGETGNPPEESKPEEKGETGNPPEESKSEEKGEPGKSPDESKSEEKEEPGTLPEEPEPSGEQGATIDTADKFIKAMENGGTVRLTQALTFDPDVYMNNVILSTDVVLDLNGQVLNLSVSSLEVGEGVSLTILDSVGDGSILSNTSIVYNTGGNVQIKGGTLQSANELNAVLNQQDGTMTITGGSFIAPDIAPGCALYAQNGTVIIEDGLFSGFCAISAYGSSQVTVTGGELRGQVKHSKKAIVEIGENVTQSA